MNIRYLLNFIITALLLVYGKGYSQNISSPYLKPDTVILQRGIYRTYHEFKANQPSGNVPFTIKEKIRIYNTFHTHTQYRIEFGSEQDKLRLENCWGFCDGKSVYMYTQTNLVGKENFEKLLVLGKYCAYEEFVFMGSTYMSASPGQFGFITEGVIRVCRPNNEGEEVTKYFIEENNIVVDLNSFNKQLPSVVYLQAITDCKMIVFSKEDWEELLT
jgi:hypothetical protein